VLARRSAAASPGETASRENAGFEAIRMKPISVCGHVAHPRRPRLRNQLEAAARWGR